MEPPGGTHTTIDLYSKLSADPTIFAKLRIKSEKVDAYKPSASISLNGLGVNFFRLYPQLCEFGGSCVHQLPLTAHRARNSE